MTRSVFFLMGLLVLSGCNLRLGSDEESRVQERSQKVSWVDWDSIPRDYNPTIDEIPFQIQGADRIDVNAFDFSRDAEVLYLPSLGKSEAILRLFLVYSGSVMLSPVNQIWEGSTLKLRQFGQYQCSILVENRRISRLAGGCYVKLQVLLPLGSQVEVINAGQYLTPRYIPMTNTEFLEEFKDQSFDAEKLKVIQDYLDSYARVVKNPRLSSSELGEVISGLLIKESRFTALRKLYLYVSDQENLDRMIDREFGYFEREEARRIVRGG